ncbi:MAG: AI-2E family transporter [Gemmatimonadales bacterium]|nr:AI-2E family transporter [Gemmatimonadales bacterium]NIN13396.1 AI-2E family transporter [Gemmatimonadales bacterium]NIN51399.1 AI-2E family transporter [Gemmatimonadales bacterium]NIP08863.1 AI-2E family transporter [Gemmatimonadales bacterium]NIQ99857.1 AI-2E family transporter [Gemmatimonadales bacterium]
MVFFVSRHQRAQILIGILGILLVFALWPYVTGLIGGPVLYVIFCPLYELVRRWIRPTLAAALVVAVAVFIVLVPGVSVAGLVVNEGQQIAGRFIQSPLVGQLGELRVGQFEVGPRLVTLGENAVAWIGSSAFGLLGTATKVALNLTIAMFALYFLLLRGGQAWSAVSPYIPFNAANTEKLQKRFRDVTNSTLIGTGLIAIAQGVLLGAAFVAVGLPSAIFWGVVTAVFAILPLVGSGLVWGPAAIALFVSGRYGAAIAIALWGLVVVASVDNFVRPIVYNKWARIHPVVTLVGALAGIRFFGILGLLIGPLALSYFFELIQMYREEYIEEEEKADEVEGLVGVTEVRTPSGPFPQPGTGGDH